MQYEQAQKLNDINQRTNAILLEFTGCKLIQQGTAALSQSKEVMDSSVPVFNWTQTIAERSDMHSNLIGSLDIRTMSDEDKLLPTAQFIGTIQLPGRGDITGIAAGHSSVVAVVKQTRKLHIMKDSKVVHSLPIPDCKDPAPYGCLALYDELSDGTIGVYYADSGRSVLQLITLSPGGTIINKDELKLSATPYSISYSPEFQEFVIRYFKKGVGVFSRNGKSIGTCQFEGDIFDGFCAIKHPDGRVITVKKSSVEWMDAKGSYSSYMRPHEDLGPALAAVPVDISVDRMSNLLVACSTHVQLLSPDGKLLKRLIKRIDFKHEDADISLCSAMTLQDGYLYVGDKSKQGNPVIKVYRYPEVYGNRHPDAEATPTRGVDMWMSSLNTLNVISRPRPRPNIYVNDDYAKRTT